MKTHRFSNTLWQMTDSGVVLIARQEFPYSGPVAECKGDKKVATDDNSKKLLAEGSQVRSEQTKLMGTDIDAYKKAIDRVASRSLYVNPERQGMVRQAVATNTDAAQKNMEGELSSYSLRTGVNTANIPAAISEGVRETRRTAHDTLVKDQLDQESKYEQAQQFAATALGQIPGYRLGAAGQGVQLSSAGASAQSGVDAQRVVPQTPWWQSVLQAGAQVGAAAVRKPPCFIAIRLWGFDDARTRLVRAWLGGWRRESRGKEMLVRLYEMGGEAIARTPLAYLFRSLFEGALEKAIAAAI